MPLLVCIEWTHQNQRKKREAEEQPRGVDEEKSERRVENDRGRNDESKEKLHAENAIDLLYERPSQLVLMRSNSRIQNPSESTLQVRLRINLPVFKFRHRFRVLRRSTQR
eukprot:TRINITY_DN35896_c0_g1_i1.p2 TRINITY_DN35896_c0_g1~~TRINITY_DN35896_c0_g1_i1.p2  ORF type:complete len:110 (-),score=10.97 TRINITY_DN35896_c0_g1_i1:97-426(-)